MKVFFSGKSHDFPKKIVDLSLAWYNQGKICISRKPVERQIQKQNIHIREVNQIVRKLWNEITPKAKRDMALYAKAYKVKKVMLRKRGISAYGVMLMIVHALIKRFSLEGDSLYAVLKTLLVDMSIKNAVKLGLLIKVSNIHQMNHRLTEELKYFQVAQRQDNTMALHFMITNEINKYRIRC